MADIFGVVADSTRREILRILLERYNQSGAVGGELSVSDIVVQLGLSQPTVSKHLKVLREAGLVGVREAGQHRYYHLDYAPLEEIEDWLIPFLSVDFDAATEGEAEEAEGLKEEQRAFATAIGKVFADTSFQVAHAVKDVKPRKWRKNE
ncbi:MULTISPECIES: helix-turn-helix transcriptional regulator [Cryobacterium]|uniref:ArsR family transcriptional regulator n=1 Tax=Cryobacterium glucosi TaxID=1259175 RepID=A0ABY2IIW7_9MICO|nr:MULTISPECIES: metalloregulator ArsR/SmtB family transcription factor [Cryobacterium]MEB0004542.1 metalloregulator ArsR/SmtB family transcription factor [Cryobacterium sp. RTC2.1]TFB94348.1 ArsR family transcriptional regulator [Cryobacterium sp. MDB2-A-1]TFC06204.1 ArsR family transcriptional regulator [Cryobacterium sp. MDB2-33-2]TFC11817.1 ArsR family transcriptional regulator [Cryobacterium sp. MDB2-A-2]TFC17747.1 ArsR family transcriptional regulator [Cryobacterium glucosi]